VIKVIDNFLPSAIAKDFSRKFFKEHAWQPYWNTGVNESNQEQWNWHTRVGNDILNMGQMSDQIPTDMELLWNEADLHITELSGVKHKLDRWYSNSHTYAQEGPIHRDDGSLTCLYYPTENWRVDWEGGTAMYNDDITDVIKYVGYKFNRMIIFKADIPHRAMPITRECYKLRTSIVFKTSMDVTDPSYAEWYSNR
jgi:hypothetical protein